MCSRRRTLLGLALLLGGGVLAADDNTYPHVNVASIFVIDAKWPEKPADFQWTEFHGIAVDAKDEVYAFTRGTPPVQVYDASGKFLRSWGEKLFKIAHSIKIDPEGNLWLGDIGLHTMQKFSPDGKLLLTLGTPGVPGRDPAHFNMPTDAVVSPAGDIFVTDGYVNARVVHFDKTGKFVKEWGELGSKPGQFSVPHSICLDSKGRLYVADRNNVRIQVFDQQGKLLDVWNDLIVPMSLCISKEDEIWVCGSSPQHWFPDEKWLGSPPRDQLLMKFDTAGKMLQLFAVTRRSHRSRAAGRRLEVPPVGPRQQRQHLRGRSAGQANPEIRPRQGRCAVVGPAIRWRKFCSSFYTGRAMRQLYLVLMLSGCVASIHVQDAAQPFAAFRMEEFDTGFKVCWSLLVEDVNGDGKKDIIVVSPTGVVWCEGPTWKRHVMVAEGATKPNSMTLSAIRADGGRLNFVLGGGWKPPFPTGSESSAVWLQPGQDLTEAWNPTLISGEPMIHRVRFADVLGEGRPQLIVAPMMGRESSAANNWLDGRPVRMLVYRVPTEPTTDRWTPEVIDESLHVVHGLTPVPRPDGKGVDLLTASYEGVHLIGRDRDRKWTKTQLTPGNQENPAGSRGSSEAKFGKLNGGRQFLATIEPWHGNQFVVYTQPESKESGALWDRHVIDDQLKYGHAVWCADLDGDGNDEVTVGAMEDHDDKPGARRGVRLYKATDATGKSWTRHVLDNGQFSVEDLAAVDLTGSGALTSWSSASSPESCASIGTRASNEPADRHPPGVGRLADGGLRRWLRAQLYGPARRRTYHESFLQSCALFSLLPDSCGKLPAVCRRTWSGTIRPGGIPAEQVAYPGRARVAKAC